MWDLIDEADVVMAHNAQRFDVRKIRGRFFVHGMGPPSPFKVIDTLKAARTLGLDSAKLDFLARLLGNDGKIKTSMRLWTGCCTGDVESFGQMLAYNKQDIAVLYDAYIPLRPWFVGHPNLAVIAGSGPGHCPTCDTEEDIHLVSDKWHVTKTQRYPMAKCDGCGSWSRVSRRGTFEGRLDNAILVPV
jgi:hypothetical protein